MGAAWRMLTGIFKVEIPVLGAKFTTKEKVWEHAQSYNGLVTSLKRALRGKSLVCPVHIYGPLLLVHRGGGSFVSIRAINP